MSEGPPRRLRERCEECGERGVNGRALPDGRLYGPDRARVPYAAQSDVRTAGAARAEAGDEADA
ncbi:hypothetical protein AB0B13_39520 [Streptomyces sp. NPDC042898]|uniref:hypothetical protein n=1 Tax=Streptomyces sp. NPDC042898 TaxID=3154334 RepID=UPI0033CDB681